MTRVFSCCIFVALNYNAMKKKKEENLPEEDCGTKMPAENEATKEVVNDETVKEEVSKEQQEDSEGDSSDDKDGGTVEIKASGNESRMSGWIYTGKR